MRCRAKLSIVSLAILSLSCLAAGGGRDWEGAGAGDRRSVLYKPWPDILGVVSIGAGIDTATISDVEVADFNGDGRPDIAVAWYATDNDQPATSLRKLSILAGQGGSFSLMAELNLYVYDPNTPGMSIFRNGTSEIGVGDFDGDGDPDLAVLPFFGDELWLVENLGGGAFVQHLKFMFGINLSSFLTPPEALAADFDRDGRDELVYVADPNQYLDGQTIHFWKTDQAIADMHRLDWEGVPDDVPRLWTRGLAVADFDGDLRPDLCFTGTCDPPFEVDPVFTVWYQLNPASGYFRVLNEFPSIICSDVVDVRPDPDCPPGLILTDINGTLMQYWAQPCHGQLDFQLLAMETGYAGLSYQRGMAAAIADVDGDGDPDLVTKQKLGGSSDANQIEITLCYADGQTWRRVGPTPIDTTGLANQIYNGILRPRNLVVADLFGNTLPEIVAGFAISPVGPGGEDLLPVAIWSNSCLGDVNVDGRTSYPDLVALWAALNSQPGDPQFNLNADLDKDGYVGQADLDLLTTDMGCNSMPGGPVAGDIDCDGVRNFGDISPFVAALMGPETYQHLYPDCQWIRADINEDGSVDFKDINPFVALITMWPAQGPMLRDGHRCGSGGLVQRTGGIEEAQLAPFEDVFLEARVDRDRVLPAEAGMTEIAIGCLGGSEHPLQRQVAQ